MVDEYIIHHDASLCWHITISIKKDIIISKGLTQSNEASNVQNQIGRELI
jgi:hypothetical protein